MLNNEEDIRRIREEIATTKKNKATNQHLGRLKAKLAGLLKERPKTSKQIDSYFIRKSGHCQVSLLGFPSVGKSSFVSQLTNVESPVGDYDFTTVRPIVGTLNEHGILFQIVDCPGILLDASKDRGKGRRVISAAKTSDLLILFIDVERIESLPLLLQEVRDSKIRLNEEPPKVLFEPRIRGGIDACSLSEHLTDEETEEIFRANGKLNGSVIVGSGITKEQLWESFEPMVYVPAFIILNKCEQLTAETRIRIEQLANEAGLHLCLISVHQNKGLERVRQEIVRASELIRVHMLPHRSLIDDPDALTEPVVLPRGSTLQELRKYLRNREIRGGFVQKIGHTKAPAKVGVNYQLEMDDCVTLL